MRQRPNIVIFNPDQWRGDACGYAGHPTVRTPNLDRLAAQGVGFSRAYCQNPVCTPSRCSFMTGWYPHTNGHRTMHHMLAPEEPELLKNMMSVGYNVLWAGKNDLIRYNDFENHCHARQDEADGGMNKPVSKMWGTNPFGPDDRRHYSFLFGKHEDENYYNGDQAHVDRAIEYLRSGPPEPFCIYLPLTFPHPPYVVDEPYYSMYDRSQIELPNIRPDLSALPLPLREIKTRMGLERLTADDYREIIAVYYGMITRTDDLLGRLLATLDETGHAAATAVFVFSDHGDAAGDFGWTEKAQNYFPECLTRVPFALRLPGCPAVGASDALVELIDFYATVEEIAALPKTHTHFGKSLVPLARGARTEHRAAVFCEGGALIEEEHTHEYYNENRKGGYWPRIYVQNCVREAHGKAVMCRTRRFKYVKRIYERDEFYDLERDPGELVNAIDNPEYRAEILRHKEMMLDWFVRTGDQVPLAIDPRSRGEWQNWPDELKRSSRHFEKFG